MKNNISTMELTKGYYILNYIFEHENEELAMNRIRHNLYENHKISVTYPYAVKIFQFLEEKRFIITEIKGRKRISKINPYFKDYCSALKLIINENKKVFKL